MTPKEKAAVELRDAALAFARNHGRLQTHSTMTLLVAEHDNILIMHRTPFTRIPQPTESVKYHAALTACRFAPKDYGLDVWANGKKVFNVEWDADEPPTVVSFKRGGWAEILLSVHRGETVLRLVERAA